MEGRIESECEGVRLGGEWRWGGGGRGGGGVAKALEDYLFSSAFSLHLALALPLFHFLFEHMTTAHQSQLNIMTIFR